MKDKHPGHYVTMEGEIVREVYSSRRKMLHTRFNPGKRWNRVWNKLGALCIEKDIDPKEYIDAQFELVKPYPNINQLVGMTAMERFEMYKRMNGSKGIEERKKEFMYELSHLSSRMDTGFTVEHILRESNGELSCLFKFFAATVFERKELAAKLKNKAQIQYKLDPASREFYSKLLPDNFVTETMDGGTNQ